MTAWLIQNKIYRTHLLAFVTLIIACAVLTVGRVPAQDDRQKAPERVQDVSIIQLIANPTAYDGKRVSVIGFTRLQFESEAVYLSSEDQKQKIDKNGLFLGIRKDTMIKHSRKECDMKYCQITGVFHATPPQSFLLWSGTISATEIEPNPI